MQHHGDHGGFQRCSAFDGQIDRLRRFRIDPVLAAAGWGTGGATIRREHICPGRIQSGGRRGKGLSCDIVLEFRGHKLAVLEAKRAGVSHAEGVGQAKDYAARLKARFA